MLLSLSPFPVLNPAAPLCSEVIRECDSFKIPSKSPCECIIHPVFWENEPQPPPSHSLNLFSRAFRRGESSGGGGAKSDLARQLYNDGKEREKERERGEMGIEVPMVSERKAELNADVTRGPRNRTGVRFSR